MALTEKQLLLLDNFMYLEASLKVDQRITTLEEFGGLFVGESGRSKCGDSLRWF